MPDFDFVYEAAKLWNRGKDTIEIAAALGMSEPEVYRFINRITELAKRIRAVSASKEGAHHG